MTNLTIDENNNAENVIMARLSDNDLKDYCMTKAMINELVSFCANISQVLEIEHYDIEWAYDGQSFIALQCRPLTNENVALNKKNKSSTGLGLVKGEAVGNVFFVNSESDARHFPIGGIMAAKRLEGCTILAATKAIGCLIESRSPLSHSAIIARELGLPAVGALDLDSIIEGKLYYMNGETGVVHEQVEDFKYTNSTEDDHANIINDSIIYNKLVSASSSVKGDFERILSNRGSEYNGDSK